jgi:hypothetical protein
MVANATDFSMNNKGPRGTSNESPGRDSNPRPAAYKAAALPLSYPGIRAVSYQQSAFSFSSSRHTHRRTRCVASILTGRLRTMGTAA